MTRPGGSKGRRRRRASPAVQLAIAVAVSLVMAAVVALMLHGRRNAGPRPHGATHAGQSVPTQFPHECPGTCDFPGALSTGVPADIRLRNVPGQVTSGRGWSWDRRTGTVQVTVDGAILSGLSIAGAVNVTASGVTISDVMVTGDGGSFGISLRHANGVVIKDSTIRGADTGPGRVGAAVADLYGDSTGTVVQGDDIYHFKTAIELTAGLVIGNYIHSPGYVTGDHTNGILSVGTTQPLMIYHNTILISRGQTDAISLDAARSGQHIANKTVEGNLLGGGSYTIYGGTARNATISNVVIENNVFSRAYYRRGGQYGPAAYYATAGPGNAWAGNIWDGGSRPVPVPGRPG